MERKLKYSTGVVYTIKFKEDRIKVIDGIEYIPINDILDRLVIDKKWANVMKESIDVQRRKAKPKTKSKGITIGDEMILWERKML